MGHVGRVACREADFGAEQWSGRLLALEPQRLWSGWRPLGRVSCGFRGSGCSLPCSTGSGILPGPGAWVLDLRNLPFWAGVASGLSSWVSEETSSLTEVRLVYDEVVVGGLCLSFLEALEEKAGPFFRNIFAWG